MYFRKITRNIPTKKQVVYIGVFIFVVNHFDAVLACPFMNKGRSLNGDTDGLRKDAGSERRKLLQLDGLPNAFCQATNGAPPPSPTMDSMCNTYSQVEFAFSNEVNRRTNNQRADLFGSAIRLAFHVR